ncbi:MAG TPA: type II toxin-antitoxin system VapC family toxin [Terriglobia bacterium]|nr:type II toxin-antitoxin system VapC family toxin [Terriglobia bacterium]
MDASITLPWCFADEATPYTDHLLSRVTSGEQVAVPSHWPVEVLNGLLGAKRRGRVTDELIRRFIDDLGGFRIVIDRRYGSFHLHEVRALAERHSLTSYDAAYLELALRSGLPLATFDAQLERAAKAEGVSRP